MISEKILQAAMVQSAIESNCKPEDFNSLTNKVVISSVNEKARKYLTLPFYCDLTSYGNNIVASVSEEIADTVEWYINKYKIEKCFETPNMQVLNDEMKKHGMCICFMAEYFLPDEDALKPLFCEYTTKLLEPADFQDFYLPEWHNALSEKDRNLDKLAVGAFDNGKLIGLAGCSADCDSMWQIGVDVLPEYRRKGVACAVTSQLAIEILKRGKVPFYCCAWSNVKSARNAIKSGLRPAWVQMTAKSVEFVAEANK